MTHMNGDISIKKISDLIEQDYIQPMIVGHSSDDDDSVKNRFYEVGAKFFLAKPPPANLLK